MLQVIMNYLNEFLGIALTGIVGFAFKQYKAHVHFKIKKEYANIAVRLVNQLYSDLKGEDKFNKASAWLSDQLAKAKIKTTPNELKGLLEAEVNFVKSNVQSDVAKVEAPKPVEQPVSPTPQPSPTEAPATK